MDSSSREESHRDDHRDQKRGGQVKRVCRFYFQNLKCKNGSSCSFIHSLDKDLERSLREKSSNYRDKDRDRDRDRNRSKTLRYGSSRTQHQRNDRSNNRNSRSNNNKRPTQYHFRSMYANNDPQRRRKPICEEFDETGKCKEGDKCRYSHNRIDSKQLCSFFMKYHCTNGDRCNYIHDYQLRQEQKLASKKVCKLFTRGECTQGDNCRNYHVPVSDNLIDPKDFEVKVDDETTFEYDEDEVKKLNINLEIPFKYKSQKSYDEEELILIRHSLSNFNYNQYRFFYQIGKSFKEPVSRAYQTSPLLVDSSLHPYGIIQCQNSSIYLEKINIHTVFISPLRRSLETAFHLFKKHPRRRYMKFIVLPQLTEILGKAQDISDLRELMQKYSFFDFELMKQTYGQNLWIWQIVDISPEELKLQFLDDLQYYVHPQTNERIPINTQSLLLEQIDKVFPKPIESVEEIYKKSQQVKEFIQRYIMDNLINVLEQKIVVVSHNCLIKNFTYSGGQDDKQNNSNKGLSLEVGEIISHKL